MEIMEKIMLIAFPFIGWSLFFGMTRLAFLVVVVFWVGPLAWMFHQTGNELFFDAALFVLSFSGLLGLRSNY